LVKANVHQLRTHISTYDVKNFVRETVKQSENISLISASL